MNATDNRRPDLRFERRAPPAPGGTGTQPEPTQEPRYVPTPLCGCTSVDVSYARPPTSTLLKRTPHPVDDDYVWRSRRESKIAKHGTACMPVVVDLFGNIDPHAIKWLRQVFTDAKLPGPSPLQRVRDIVTDTAITTWKCSYEMYQTVAQKDASNLPVSTFFFCGPLTFLMIKGNNNHMQENTIQSKVRYLVGPSLLCCLFVSFIIGH